MYSGISKNEERLRKTNTELLIIFTKLNEVNHSYKITMPKVKIKEEINIADTKMLFLEFVKTMLPNDFYAIAKRIAVDGRIKASTTAHIDYKDECPIINFRNSHNLTSVSDCAHGFGHILLTKQNFTTNILGETIPLLFENIVEYYLIYTGYDVEEFRLNKYRQFTDNSDHIQTYLDTLNTSHMFLSYDVPYVISSLLAVQLCKSYSKNPGGTIIRTKEFINCLNNDDFNGALESIGIDIKYVNDHLIIDNKTILNLIDTYLEYYINGIYKNEHDRDLKVKTR